MNSYSTDFSTVEEMKDYFLRRTEIIINCLKYRSTGAEVIRKSFDDIEDETSELRECFSEVRKELTAKRENVVKMQSLIVKVENISKKLDHMETNFPSVLKKPVEVEEKKVDCVKGSILKENRSTSNEVKCNTKIKQMQYLTLPQFDSIPKYMKGRIKYDQVNKFIKDFNSTVEKKYQLLRMPQKDLKLPQRHLVQDFKTQENSETKGLYFCTNDDMKEYGNVKLDKTTSSFITILRHCMKLKEIRSPGLIRYVILE